MTNVEALKRLYQQIGGDPETLDANTNLELLNAISETLGGEVGAEQNADGIDNVAAVASGGGGSYETQTVTLNINDQQTNISSGTIATVEFHTVVNGRIELVPVNINKGAASITCDVLMVGNKGYIWAYGVDMATSIEEVTNREWLIPTYGSSVPRYVQGITVSKIEGTDPTPCSGTLRITNQQIA